jgi:hypothetical protein
VDRLQDGLYLESGWNALLSQGYDQLSQAANPPLAPRPIENIRQAIGEKVEELPVIQGMAIGGKLITRRGKAIYAPAATV